MLGQVDKIKVLASYAEKRIFEAELKVFAAEAKLVEAKVNCACLNE